MAITCPGCGHENNDYLFYCGKCSKELPRPPRPREDPSPSRGRVQPQPGASALRMCVSCGRSIPFDAFLCPYCGHDFSRPAGAMAQQDTLSGEIRILLYIVSVLVPIVGIVIGIVFIMKPEPDYKHVGKNCLLIGVIISALSVLVYIALIGWMMSLAW